MKNIFCILILLSVTIAAKAQRIAPYYSLAWEKLREGNVDTALIYADNAAAIFTSKGDTDSLAMTLALRTTIVWEKAEWPEAKHAADSSVSATFSKLPLKSEGRVMLNSVIGNLYATKYQFDSAALYFDQALLSADTTKQSRSLVILYHNLCKMATLQENAALADHYFNKAYQNAVLLDGKNATSLIDILLARTQGLIVNLRYTEAMQMGFNLEKIIHKHYGNTNIKQAKNYANLSTAFYYLSRYEEGLHYRQKALQIYQFHKLRGISNNNSFYVAYYNMGQLYYYLHEYTLAQQYLHKALDLGTEIFGRQSLGMINMLVQYATAQQKLGKFDVAHRYFNEAYDIQKIIDPGDDLALAYIETFYGDLFKDEGNFDSSIVYYQLANKRFIRANNVNSYYDLYNKAGLATAYNGSGRNEEALALQKIILKNFRQSFPELTQPVVEFLNNIAESYIKLGRYDSAAMYSDSAFLYQSTFKSLPGKATEWLYSIPFSYKVCEQVQTRIELLRGLHKQTGDSSSLLKIIELADAYSGYIAANLYMLRTESSLIEQAALNKAIFSAGIDACWMLAQNTNSSYELLQKAFFFSEQSKALMLRLASNSVLIDDALEAYNEVVEKDIALKRQVSSLREQYYNAEENQDSLLHLMTSKVEEYKFFQDSLKKTEDPYFKKRYELGSYTIADIRRILLSNDETLLEYALTHEGLYIFTITADNFYVSRTDTSDIHQVELLRNPQKLDPQEYVEYAHNLYQQLILPGEPHFASDKIIIIPDDELYYLNFESLVADKKGNDYSSLSYLIKKYVISYELSVNTAIQLKNSSARENRYNKALIFAPVFTDSMKRSYQKTADYDSSFLVLFRQPFALQAAKYIKKLIPSDLFVEDNALEHNFKKSAAGYKLLHLGTHTKVNNEDPLQSKLFFARSFKDSSFSEDGDLHAYEVYPLQLHAKLAVLTACETGGGALRSGEGVMSLAYSFMFAGCPAVVMSLWNIDEKTNAEITKNFYKNLKAGNNKSKALRGAKLSFLKKNGGELANPFYWAGLCLIGDDAPVYNNYVWYWIAGLLFFSISIILIVRYKNSLRRKPSLRRE